MTFGQKVPQGQTKVGNGWEKLKALHPILPLQDKINNLGCNYELHWFLPSDKVHYRSIYHIYLKPIVLRANTSHHSTKEPPRQTLTSTGGKLHVTVVRSLKPICGGAQHLQDATSRSLHRTTAPPKDRSQAPAADHSGHLQAESPRSHTLDWQLDRHTSKSSDARHPIIWRELAIVTGL